MPLSQGTLARTREVIDIPQIEVQVIHHKLMEHYCRNCKKRHTATVDLSSDTLPNRRFGIRVMSLIGMLSIDGRMPVKVIQALLKSLGGIQISAGEITDILHVISDKGRNFLSEIHENIRRSVYVHADETGWREDGINGYVWSFSTPRERLYLRDQSRAHTVPKEALGENYKGVIVSDFFGAYNYHLGEHQRCWVHFFRDLKKLGEEHPENVPLLQWSEKIKALYDSAKSFQSVHRHCRVKKRFALQGELVRLGERYNKSSEPHRVLAQRLVIHANGMFTFIEYPGMPSENNPAERAIRPMVIARKICGGTRSKRGSDTKMRLASIYQTWKLRNMDPLTSCEQMLSASSRAS
jgi:hypothetical protein